MSSAKPEAIVFDAYGTLFDIASLVDEVSAELPNAATLIQVWRSKQVEYSLIRTMTDRYEDFLAVTRDALEYAIEASAVSVSDDTLDRWVNRWRSLPPYPDVRRTLEELAEYPRIILSNGSATMLASLVNNAGLDDVVDDILTADQVQRFKPDASIYALAPAALKLPKERILFVTANGFDIAGARSFGFQVCRIDRAGTPTDHTGWTPHVTVGHLDEIVSALRNEGWGHGCSCTKGQG